MKLTEIQRMKELAGIKESEEKNGIVVDAKGHKYWYQNGLLHRDDGPAIVSSNGYQGWYQHDKLHREDGPAEVWSNGDSAWYRNGKLHRDGGPAVEAWDRRAWYQSGELHRDGGPAEVDVKGDKSWYQHGKLHRLNGPAETTKAGSEFWFVNNERCRGWDDFQEKSGLSDAKIAKLKAKYKEPSPWF